jgi:hypothetical protein
MTISEIEDLRAKGWNISFSTEEGGWSCILVGKGLAHGSGGGETLEKAAEMAFKQAQTMEDDPQVLIKKYAPQIEELLLRTFGDSVVYQGMDVVRWEPAEPAKIALSVESKVPYQKYVELEVAFIRRAMAELPREVWVSLVFEVDWPEEKVKS